MDPGIPDTASLLEAIQRASEIEDLAVVFATVDAFRYAHVQLLLKRAMEVRLVDIGLMDIYPILSYPNSHEGGGGQRERVGHGSVLAEAPALGVPVTHRFAVNARARRRERESLVGGREIFTGGRVESLNFGKRGPEAVVTEEVKLVTRLLARETRLGRRRRRVLARWKTGGGGVTTTSRA